jgi:hypothetical protein
MPSPGEPQAEPTIGKTINGGYDLLEAQCNRCDRVSLVPLRSLKQPHRHWGCTGRFDPQWPNLNLPVA